ncbi:snakin-2-like [Malania oleifera]|uniref:snakin-2-like n=1 Tax=Malania oleifera TaxID=397392 RepID=UPI0025ADF41D|nr:snakin-2-like [Malania oleifera]
MHSMHQTSHSPPSTPAGMPYKYKPSHLPSINHFSHFLFYSIHPHRRSFLLHILSKLQPRQILHLNFELASYPAMAFSKTLILINALLLLSLLVAAAPDLHNLTNSNNPTDSSLVGPSIDCGAACAARCRLSSRPNLCKRACGTCCTRCNCVPPGTSGNLDTCPCYANMKTHGNKRKCP